MSALSPRSETAPNPTPARDDGRKPRSLADRLRLGLILLLLPATAVCIPIAAVTYFFGQRPRSGATVETEVLQRSLEQSANQLLPAPATLGPDPIILTVRADHLDARMKKVSDQAREFGGSASEGLSTATERRLSIALPAGGADAFRTAVKSNAALGSSAPSASPVPAGRDFVDVVIRAAGDDE